MKYRTFGRLGWQVSEIGCGMGGLWEGWDGWDDPAVGNALLRAAEVGCNFFDTALSYGDGYSEKVLGNVVQTIRRQEVFVATKISVKDGPFPTQRGAKLSTAFPPDYIQKCTETSLRNLGVDCIDLMQFHTWEDAWAHDESWINATDRLKREGLVRAWGISVNRWEPWNVLKTLQTGLIDAVQVCFNIFDQSPADELLPMCAELGIAVIARSPFDEGALTGRLTANSTWPEGDWRNTYFATSNLAESVLRAGKIEEAVEAEGPIAEVALRFILSNEAVTTVIPGMRSVAHVERNCSVSELPPLSPEVVDVLRRSRWEREVPARTRTEGLRTGL